ncbi:MAG TPA: hypothetical protein VGG85_19525 [Terracidiphilus sp.]
MNLFSLRAESQQSPALPAVNLGDTSFLDAIAFPGWVVELIGQGVHDNKTLSNTGQVIRQITDVNSLICQGHPRQGPFWQGLVADGLVRPRR